MTNQNLRFADSILRYLTLLKLTKVFSPAILLTTLIFAGLCPPAVSSRAVGSVTLSATPASRTVEAGQSAVYTINLNRDNFAGNVTLGATNLPTGATASFSPNPTTRNTSLLTITTRTTTPTGSFTVKIGANAAGIAIAPVNIMLIVQRTQSVTLSAFPDSASIIAGQTVTAEINLARTNYDGAIILSAENLPAGVSVSFDKNPPTGLKTTMRIYSHGLPHVWKENLITVRATLRDLDGRFTLLPFRLTVNCGIDWVQQFGSNQTDARHNDLDRNGDVTVDGSGNVYVVGNTYGTLEPQNPFQGGTDVWLAKFDNLGNQNWIRQIGSTEEDRATEVVADSAGNVFLGGFSAGDLPGETNLGNHDFWIAKYDSSGNRLWITESGTQQQDGKFGLVIVPDGSGGGKLVTFTAERTRITTFLFDANGNLAEQSGFTHLFQHTPYDLALGPNNTIYAVGTFTDLSGAVKEFIVKYDAQGNELWRNTYGSPYLKKATRIAVDSAGNAFVAGIIEPPPPAFAHPKAWIAKYDAGSGGILWSKYEPSDIFNLHNDLINAVGIDSHGDVIIAGMTQGVIGEKNGDDTFLGIDDAWVSRRNGSNGELVWVRQFPVSDIDGFEALAFDNNKGIILAGYTVAFKNNIGFEDALLMRYVDSVSGTTVQLLPYVTGVVPASERVGRTIRIEGVNFFGITGVRFNGVPAQYNVISTSRIEAVVPTGATNGLITISKGCSSFASPSPFTILP